MDADPLAQLPDRPEVVIEAPRFSFVKRRADGRVDFVSPLPCPYNYGSIPGRVSEDGDPLDAIVLGPRLARGARVSAPVVAIVDFLDGGEADPKVVCSERPLSAWQRAGLVGFFRVYAIAKRGLARVRGGSRATAFRGWVRG